MRRLALLALAGTALLAGNASAANVGGSFQVKAVVPASCVVVSSTGIDFGSYDPLTTHATTDDTAMGDIVVRCTKGTVLKVTLDQGTNPDSGSDCATPLRQMKNAVTGDLLPYKILHSAGGTTWGCDAANDHDYTALNNGPYTMTTYGEIPAGANVGSGTFLDQVTYTVTF